MAQIYRKERIDIMQQHLNGDSIEAKKQYERHKTKGAILEKTEYGLTSVVTAMGICTSSIIVSPPAGIAMAIITGICGTALIAVKVINKKCSIKTQKWYDMYNLIDNTSSQISEMVSELLDDDTISLNEFKKITNEYELYREKLTTLRNEYLKREKTVHKSHEEAG